MATPLIAGLSIAAAAMAAKYGIAVVESWQTAARAGGTVAGATTMRAARRFYEGGFEQKMTRKEAALVLGIRELAAAEKVKEAHRKVMIANHPDSGGSAYIAAKVNEAKDLLLGKRKSGSSPFD